MHSTNILSLKQSTLHELFLGFFFFILPGSLSSHAIFKVKISSSCTLYHFQYQDVFTISVTMYILVILKNYYPSSITVLVVLLSIHQGLGSTRDLGYYDVNSMCQSCILVCSPYTSWLRVSS